VGGCGRVDRSVCGGGLLCRAVCWLVLVSVNSAGYDNNPCSIKQRILRGEIALFRLARPGKLNAKIFNWVAARARPVQRTTQKNEKQIARSGLWCAWGLGYYTKGVELLVFVLWGGWFG